MTIGRLSTEGDKYRRARDELLDAEIALRDQRERVADLRRKLPLDTEIEDYVFHEGSGGLGKDGPISEVRLSSLADDPDKPLIVYQYMYGGAQTAPCEMCTMWVDDFNGVAQDIGHKAIFVIVAQTEIGTFRSWGRGRGWHNLRLLSSAGSTFKTDLKFQDEEGRQFPGLSVFSRASDGTLRHFYSGSAIMREGEYRGMDLYTPVWNLLDVTPNGRGDWLPKLQSD